MPRRVDFKNLLKVLDWCSIFFIILLSLREEVHVLVSNDACIREPFKCRTLLQGFLELDTGIQVDQALAFLTFFNVSALL